MDKYEYKIRAEEINSLIEQKKFVDAVKIADTIDWRRVKSVKMLCKVSELYKMNRRYEDSKEILLLADEHLPNSRNIIYSLCELSIKLEDLIPAVEYYKQFVQIAPRDTGRYILQYRLYEAQDVSLEERIAVLEEYKKRDYREKWAYELAYLYHRIGLATRCVEECDELILWFGEGKYVIKAMELKMLHAPLTTSQQEKYDQRFATDSNAYVVKKPDETKEAALEKAGMAVQGASEVLQESAASSVTMDTIPSMPIQIKSVEVSNAPTMRIPSKKVEEEMQKEQEVKIDLPEIPLAETKEEDIQVKTPDMGKFNTINLQKELAKSLAEVMQQEDMDATDATRALPIESIQDFAEGAKEAEEEQTTEDAPETEQTKELKPIADTAVTRAVIEEVRKALGEEPQDTITEEDLLQSLAETEAETAEPEQPAVEEEAPVAPVVEQPIEEAPVATAAEQSVEVPVAEPEAKAEPEVHATEDTTPVASTVEQPEEASVATAIEQPVEEQPTSEPVQETAPQSATATAQPDDSEENPVEKQITGQLSFNDIMAGWEETKKAAEERRLEEMRKKVMAQTGPLLQDYEEPAAEGLLDNIDMITPAITVFDNSDIPEVDPMITDEDEVEELTEIEPVEQIDDLPKEPVTKEFDFDTAEINGIEEKLINSVEKTAEELKEPEPEPVNLKGVSVTEEFDKDLERQILEALDEKEKTSDSHADEAKKSFADAEFKITDLDAEDKSEEPEEVAIQEVIDTVSDNFDKESEKAVSENKEDENKEDTKSHTRRQLSKEEKELFGMVAKTKKVQEEIAHTVDNISLDPAVGNVIITGEKGVGTLELATNIIKEVSVENKNFSGRVAKITGEQLNTRNIPDTLKGLNNGALIIEQAGDLSDFSLIAIADYLRGAHNDGLIIFLEDTKQALDALCKKDNMPLNSFNLRIDVAALDNDGLVNFGREYALEQEYSIDEMGMLALYTSISNRQTSQHAVTVEEVKEIVDQAIIKSEKGSVSHIMDVILKKRYDENDMIILREKDFL
ncbi:MAG: hypothetical protein PUD03_07060 [Lachnospiraceae bacterium]|nr:hypothetical protein [Lachnospiraceae bacterium]